MTTEETGRLLKASTSGDLDELRRLAAAGVDLDCAMDLHGNTAAELAAMKGKWPFVLEVAALGGDLHRHGLMSCLAWAASSAPEMCKTLLEAGCPHSETDGSSQALQSAAEANDPGTVDLLLGAGASLDTPSAKGRTPLSAAARMGHEAMVAHLLAHGANPNAGGGDELPLFLAQQHGRVECVRLLLQANASLQPRDANGSTVIDRAQRSGQRDIVALCEAVLHPREPEPAPAERAPVSTETFESLEALLRHWGAVDRAGPFAWRVRNGPWTAWVRSGLDSFDCTVALELYGVDPDAEWPVALLVELARQAIETVKRQRPSHTAPMPSLAAYLDGDGVELAFDARSLPPQLLTERDWGLAFVDHRADAFGGRFFNDGVPNTVVSLIPLTLGEWVFRDAGYSVAHLRALHEALDRDVLACPYWREAWNAEAGRDLPDWLALQPTIRRRVSARDGAQLPP